MKMHLSERAQALFETTKHFFPWLALRPWLHASFGRLAGTAFLIAAVATIQFKEQVEPVLERIAAATADLQTKLGA